MKVFKRIENRLYQFKKISKIYLKTALKTAQKSLSECSEAMAPQAGLIVITINHILQLLTLVSIVFWGTI